MSNCVVVSGLPKNVKKQKMVHFLRNYVFKKPPVQFWIESMNPTSNSLKEMLIRFETEAAADFAARTLQDYSYQHTDQQIYTLKCWIKSHASANVNSSQEFSEDVKIDQGITPVEYQRPYSPIRERDRSPHLRDELTKLELEIELTNKKRMLLEAERNLLMEQKRLEMLQKTGIPDVPVQDSAKSSASAPAPPSVLPKKKERKRPQDQSPHPGEPSKKLYWPCKIIMKDMYYCIRKHVDADKRPSLNALLRNVIKKRLCDMLGDEPYYYTKKCISMYRMLYPKHADEDFVIKLRDMILQGQLPQELQGAQSDAADANMTNASNIDPSDLPISELSKDLDEWTEDTT